MKAIINIFNSGKAHLGELRAYLSSPIAIGNPSIICCVIGNNCMCCCCCDECCC